MFMAPEGLNKDSRKIEKTDIYSFAVTVLFLMFPVDLAIKLLFLPISKDLEIFRQNVHRFKLLEMILKSLRWNPEKRVTSQRWCFALEKIKELDKNMLIEKISSENLERKGLVFDPLNNALENEGGLYFFILEFFGYEMNSDKVNKNEAWKMTTALSYMQNLSSIYCDQKFRLVSKGVILKPVKKFMFF